MEGLYSKWQTDVPDMDEEDWEDICEYPFLQLGSNQKSLDSV